MNRLSKRYFGPLLVVLAALAAGRAAAQDPVLVLSMKSTDALLSDLRYILSTTGTEGELIDALIDSGTQGKGLIGIDKTRPIGGYMTMNAGGTPDFVLFVPVNDNQGFRELLATAMPRQQDVAGGMFMLEGEDQQFYGKFANGHCFLSALPTALNRLPDPARFASSKYSFGIDAQVGRIPSEVLDGLVEQLEEMLIAFMQPPEDLDAAPVAVTPSPARKRTDKMVRDILRMLARESDRITFGVDVDQKSKNLNIEVDIVPKTGSPLAASMSTYGKMNASFAALAGPDALASAVLAMPLTGELRGIFRETVEAALDKARRDIDQSPTLTTADQKRSARELLERVGELARATGESGQMDAAVVVHGTEDGRSQIVAAGRVSDGAELARALDEFVKQSAGNQAEKVRLDVAKHSDVRIHQVTLDLSDAQKSAVGDDPGHLGIAGDSVYFAIGGDSLGALKAAIDQRGQASPDRPPTSIRARPGKLIAAAGKADDPDSELAREAFDGAGDHLSVEMVTTQRGGRIRIELGEGFLRYIALTFSQQMGG